MPEPVRPNPALTPPGVLGPAAPAGLRPTAATPALQGPAFDEVLKKTLDGSGGVRFSGHALQRLERRGIEIDEAMAARLNEGIDRAAAKGSRDSLVLLDGTAFVVSVANRTVITAVDESSMRDRVFTNIDSAVIS
jgi:flagellar operon protein